jgi:hypothetical protein
LIVKGARSKGNSFQEVVSDLSFDYVTSKIKAVMPAGIKRKIFGFLENGLDAWDASDLLKNLADPDMIKEFNRKHKNTPFVDLDYLRDEINEAERRLQERREEQRKREEERKLRRRK